MLGFGRLYVVFFQMTASYAGYIRSSLNSVLFLDGQVLKLPLEQSISKHRFDSTGTLRISFFRIMGIPQPTAEKINNKVSKIIQR